MDILAQDRQDAIRGCLEKILDSKEFASSERLSAFLRYIVTETLEGRAERLKGYAIALSVFGANEEFDPQSNSIVRVEASRLRKRLSDFYAELGADDPFEIRVNRGTYAPQFIERPSFALRRLAAMAREAERSSPAPAATTVVERTIERDAQPVKVPRMGLLAAGFGALAIAAVSIYAFVQPAQKAQETASAPMAESSADFSDIPSISVSELNVEQGVGLSTATAQILTRDLLSVLGRFDFVRVRDPQSMPKAKSAEYRLDGDFGRRNDKASISLRLAHGPSGQIIWSRTYQFDGPAFDEASWEKITSSIATVLMRSGGVVHSDRFRRMPAQAGFPQGFSCYASGAKHLEAPTQAGFEGVRECLERILKADPKQYLAHAMLAILFVDAFTKGFTEQPGAVAMAVEHANQAVTLAPQSGYAHLVYYIARFADRRYEDAFESAEKAIALNPYSVEIRGRVAIGYVLRGNLDRARPLLNGIAATVDNGPIWLDIYMALTSYLSGDLATATRIAGRTRVARAPLGMLLRVILAQANNDAESAARSSAMLNVEFPGFARDIQDSLDRLGFTPEMQRRLLSGYKQGHAPETTGAAAAAR